MKTLLKLSLIFCLLIEGLIVKSEGFGTTPLLDYDTVKLCLPEQDTVHVTNTAPFKVYLWQIAIVGENTWVDVTSFDNELFPVKDSSFLIIPGNLTLDNHKVRCIASLTPNILQGTPSAEVPIFVGNPIIGPGKINGNILTCYGTFTPSTYYVTGYTNATSYDWILPPWVEIVSYYNEAHDSILITGTAPSVGTNTEIKAIPKSYACGHGTPCSMVWNITGMVGGVGTILGKDTLCMGKEESYSVNGIQRATSYYWIVPSGITITSPNPGSSASVSLVASSDLGGQISVIPYNSCDSGNIVVQKTIHVYNQLDPGTLGSDIVICFKSSPGILGFVTAPSGPTFHFTYQWQDSTATNPHWSNISSANSSVYTPGNLIADHYYRVQVAEDVCGAVRYTAPMKVMVYPKLVAGRIGDDQSICENAQPDTVQLVTPTTGGAGTYSYQWIYSVNHTIWENIGDLVNHYLPPPLSQDTYYKLIITSSSGCGIDTTNEQKIVVKPLPLSVSIQGGISVCRNQMDAQYVADPLRDYTYSWSMQNNLGAFETGKNTYRTYIHWGNVSGLETLMLREITDSAHCESITTITVNVMAESSPNQTFIIRKPNSNILICGDTSDNIKYQWGFIPKSTGIPDYIIDGNLRYVVLPHNFDTTATGYNYFVDTYFEYAGGDLSCYTRSYMKKIDLPIGTEDPIPVGEVSVFPNPSRGTVQLNIPKPYADESFQFELFDIWGRKCFHANLSPSERPSISLPHDLNNGMYILRLTTSTAAVFITRFVLDQ
jgi:hypothetical protein